MKTTPTFATLLRDQLESNGYTIAEFLRGYKKAASLSWKRGYASAHGLLYGDYIEKELFA
jgi:hypothetical protein